MKALLAFVAGLAVGAGGMLYLSRPTRPAPPPPAPTAVPVASLPSTPAPAPATVAPFTEPAPASAEPVAAEPMKPPDVGETDLDYLAARGLALPVPAVPLKQIRDTFAEKRGDRVHEAIDILAPRGTAVHAVDDGVVRKLFDSRAGGLTVYQFDPGERYAYYYAHLDRYADGLAEGRALKRGDLVGYVGTTGNAPKDAPHLHFAVFRLEPAKEWWKGTAVDPFPVWVLGATPAGSAPSR